MSIESRTYDRPNTDGFPPNSVAVIVVDGTYDVSRVTEMLSHKWPEAAGLLARQLRRHNTGRAALKLLATHGGPDLLEEPITTAEAEVKRLTAILDNARVAYGALSRRLETENAGHGRDGHLDEADLKPLFDALHSEWGDPR